jgi:hypothetical protein
VTLGATLGLFTAPVHAGQPSWASIQQRTFVIRYHTTLAPAASDTSGIWDFDPLTGAYQRLRPFHYNAAQYGVIDGPGGNGQGSYLATMGDRLVFEAWPSIIEFDAASLRIVRRYAMFGPPLHYFGWAIQGPIIDAGLSAKTGLPQGIYGFVTCVYGVVSGNGGWGGKGCEPTLFPGYDGPIQYSENEVFFRRPLGPATIDLTPVLHLAPSMQDPALTAFAPVRQGFWLGTKTTLSFYPIASGGLGSPTETIDLTGPPLNDTDLWLHTVFYHPTRKFFLLRWTDDDSPTYQRLSVLSDDLTHRLTDDVVGEPGRGAPPITFSAFAGDPPAQKVQTIPIVVHAPGKNQTFWTSDLYLYNPSADPLTVSVRRVTKPAETRTIELPGHGSKHIPDVLSWAGGGPQGDGVDHDALVLTTPYRWGDNLVAAARVWTPDSNPELRAKGGTMGQAVPAVPDTVGYSNHLPWEEDVESINGGVYAYQFPKIRNATLILDYRQPGRFRHNLGVVNDGDQPLTVRLTWSSMMLYLYNGGLDGAGAPSQRSFEVPAHSVTEISIEKLFPDEIRNAYFPRLWVVADRPASIWFTMVDNVTGDAVFVPYTLLDQLGDDFTRAAVPAVAHLPGKNGTFWQTDLYTSFMRPVYLDPIHLDTPQSWFHPSNPGTGCGGATGEISQEISGVLPMNPATWKATLVSINYPLSYVGQELWGWRNIFPDLIHRFSACASDDNVRGAFEMKEGSWMGAYTRTYTTRADGGTYGGMLPLYPPHGWPVQHFAGIAISPSFRINVGLYNGDATHAIVNRLILYDADGNEVAHKDIALEPWANLIEPLETSLGMAKGSLPAGIYGLTVLPLDDQAQGVEGRSWAFVSVVDNVTGDSTNWW